MVISGGSRVPGVKQSYTIIWQESLNTIILKVCKSFIIYAKYGNLYYCVVKKERRLALPLIRTEDIFMMYNTHKAKVSYFETTLFFNYSHPDPTIFNNF